jgi:hypothetical protein
VIPLAAKFVGLTSASLTPSFTRLKLAPESIRNWRNSPSTSTSRSSSFPEAPTTKLLSTGSSEAPSGIGSSTLDRLGMRTLRYFSYVGGTVPCGDPTVYNGNTEFVSRWGFSQRRNSSALGQAASAPGLLPSRERDYFLQRSHSSSVPCNPVRNFPFFRS